MVQATINIRSGTLKEELWLAKAITEKSEPVRPVRYFEGTPHFETVKKFIESRTNFHPTKGIEYLEWEGSDHGKLFIRMKGGVWLTIC